MLHSPTNSITSDFSLDWYQVEAIDLLAKRDGKAGLFADMGTGKTRVALAYLFERAERILVVCPLSVIGVWRMEIERLPIRSYSVISLTDGGIEQRSDTVRRQAAHAHQIVLVNYESYWREPLRSALLAWKPDAVILDEAHRTKRRQARQSKFAHYLADHSFVRYRLALTGTPITQGVEDLYSIYRFIDTHVFGKRWADFELSYLIRGGYLGKQIVGYRNQEIIQRLVAETSYRITRDEAFKLPTRTDVVVPVDLSKATVDTYMTMKRKALVEIDGLDSSGQLLHGTALARIALTSVLRLQQITSGFLTTDSGLVDISAEKLDVCTDLVHDAIENHERVAIFCRFSRDCARLSQRLQPYKFGLLTGSTPGSERETIIRKLHAGGLNGIISQIKVGSLGIDLTPCNIGIFYSTGFALDEYQQARDRLHRRGQTRSVVYYLLQAVLPGRKASIDNKVYTILNQKQKVSSSIISNREFARSLFITEEE